MGEDLTYTTAEISEGFTLSGGSVATLTVWTDRKMAARGGLTKGRMAASLLADDVPALLRDAAGLFEQEGGWDGVVAAVERAREEARA